MTPTKTIKTRPRPIRTPRGGAMLPATAQRDAARRNRYEVIYERTLLLALLTAKFPSHIAPVRAKISPTDEWKWVVCVHTPTANLAWKISDEDRTTIFAKLLDRPDDADTLTKEAKVERLEELVALTAPLVW
jgi:hypothetical protein